MADEKFMKMAGEMLGDEDCPVRVAPWASVVGARVWLAGHLEDVAYRVDAEAVERMAKLCESQPGHAWCAHAIRSTLPTPAARAGEDEKENTKT